MATTPAERLKQIRKERFRSAAEAARAIGVRYPTYAGHENGTRPMSRDFAIRYARFFKINLDWLLSNRGHPRSVVAIQRLYDELPTEGQADALAYFDYLRERYKSSVT